MSLRNKFFLAIGSLLILVAYTNCSDQGFTVDTRSLTGGEQGASSGSSNGTPPGSTGTPSGSTGTGTTSCEEDLLKVYSQSYHPFLSKTCVACHVNGPGIGAFASSDVQTSFDSFMSIGVDRIKANAVNPNHQPPITGTQNQAAVNSADLKWNQGIIAYNACQSALADSGAGSSASVVTTSGLSAANVSSYNTTKFTWDLETQSDGKLPLLATMYVTQYVYNGSVVGYAYSKLSLALKTIGQKYVTDDIQILINGVAQTDVTAYSNVHAVISSTTPVILGEPGTITINVRPVASTDMISLRFNNLLPSP